MQIKLTTGKDNGDTHVQLRLCLEMGHCKKSTWKYDSTALTQILCKKLSDRMPLIHVLSLVQCGFLETVKFFL